MRVHNIAHSVSQLRANETRAELDALRFRMRFFDPFLVDKDVQEIAVNRLGEVILWKGGVWESVALPDLDYSTLEEIGANLANFTSKPFNRENTSLSAHLPSGERIEMTHPPTAPENTFYLNIRKHSAGAFDHQELVKRGYYERTKHECSLSLTKEKRDFYAPHLSDEELELWELASTGKWAQFMERSVPLHQNIVVSGATGSGKTSYIRSLIEMIDPSERIITVEDTPEMPLSNHPNNNSLFYRKATTGEGASAKDVLHSVMRKTPDRVLLAELRGDEAMFYLSGVLSSGHPGGMTTTHANSPRDAFYRLALLIKSSSEGQGIELGTILNMLHMTVNVVAQLKFDKEIGMRHVPAIYYDPMYRLSLLG